MVATAILKYPKSRYLDNGLIDRHEIWQGDTIRYLRSGLEVEWKKCRYGLRIDAPMAPRGVRGEGVPLPAGGGKFLII